MRYFYFTCRNENEYKSGIQLAAEMEDFDPVSIAADVLYHKEITRSSAIRDLGEQELIEQEKILLERSKKK